MIFKVYKNINIKYGNYVEKRSIEDRVKPFIILIKIAVINLFIYLMVTVRPFQRIPAHEVSYS